MEIGNNLRNLRTLIRNNYKEIIDYISVNYAPAIPLIESRDICMFCAAKAKLTKEHVIPKWVFDNKPDKFFHTTINNSKSTYSKATINVCKSCNSHLLGSLEKYIKTLFEDYKKKKMGFYNTDISIIIRWLEIIEYKFQITDIRKRFNKKAGYPFIPYLRDIPISLMSTNDSPGKVISNLRKSLKRISVKDKSPSINSLIVLHSKNKSFHFFHKNDEFIFLELPKYEIAIFYFYKEIFKSNSQAHARAKEILSKNY